MAKILRNAARAADQERGQEVSPSLGGGVSSAFSHKQTVAFRKSRDDWSETATIRAAKRDLRPMGYWLVRFKDGGELCVHETNLRAA